MCLQYINEIPGDVFSDLKQIGSGSFSTIFSSIYKNINAKVALKVSVKIDGNHEDSQIIHQEIRVHRSLNHPLICKYYTNIETEHLNIIVMEFIEGYNLLECLNRNGSFPINDIKKIFSQILIVIEYLHDEQNITHRDLKLENIMIDNYGNIRLIDFGFSSPKRIMSTLCGSIPYCSPEVLRCDNYTKKADIWCLGVILYSLVYGKLPFYDKNMAKLANIIQNNEPEYKPISDALLLDLLQKLLMKDPCQRLSIDDIKNHFWLAHVRLLQINYKQLFSPESHHQNQFVRRKSVCNIKMSMSHPRIKNWPFIDSPQKTSLSVKNLQHNQNHSKFEDLQSMITMHYDNVDVLIEKRKDFSKNLNQLLESAFLVETPNFANENDISVRLEAVKPVRFNFPNVVIRRNLQNKSSLNQIPQIKKPILKNLC